MKSYFAVFMVFVLMLSHINKLLVLIDFSINQNYISNTFCINKAKPALNCNGKCYLAQKLKEQEEKEKNQIPSALKEKNQTTYICSFSKINLVYPIVLLNDKKVTISQRENFSPAHLDRVFRPPKVYLFV